MKEQRANELEKSVIAAYDTIATHFSETRSHDWLEFDYFLPYIHNKGGQIVDVGCGNGRLFKYLTQKLANRDFSYLGIDNNSSFIKIAQEKYPKTSFILGELTKIPLPDHCVDNLFAIASFHHLANQKNRLDSLKEMKRVLKPGGRIFLTNWNLKQKKYWKHFFIAGIKCLFSFGKSHYNDLQIEWKNAQGEIQATRYYFAFSNQHLLKLFKKNQLKVVSSFSVKKGKKVAVTEGYNFCHILENE